MNLRRAAEFKHQRVAAEQGTRRSPGRLDRPGYDGQALVILEGGRSVEDPPTAPYNPPPAEPGPPPTPTQSPTPPPPPAPNATPPPNAAPPSWGAPSNATPPPAPPAWREPPWRPPPADHGRNISLIFGVIILLVGLWFFASRTLGLDLPDISWSQLWPLILIGVGAWIVYGAMRRNR